MVINSCWLTLHVSIAATSVCNAFINPCWLTLHVSIAATSVCNVVINPCWLTLHVSMALIDSFCDTPENETPFSSKVPVKLISPTTSRV